MAETNLLAQVRNELVTADQNVTFEGISILEHLSVIRHNKLLICAVALTVTLIGVAYAFVKPAVYEGNVLIAVSDVGSGEKKGPLGISSNNPIVRTAMSEAEILRSRLVIGAVVDALELNSVAEPKYFPVIGAPYARFEQDVLSKLFPSLKVFHTGTQRIEVAFFDVSAIFLNQPFILTYDGYKKFELRDQSGRLNLVGQVGQVIETRFAGSRIRLLVERLEGKEGARFTITKVPKLAVIEELRSALDISEVSKGSGMINVVYSDTDPIRAGSILNELSRSYFRFVESQTERESLQALALLQSQLPKRRERVSSAESRYQKLKEQYGTVDVEEETKLGLTRSSTTEEQLSELRRKRAEMSVRLGENHPLLVAVNQEIGSLSRDKASVKNNISKLPAIAREISDLERVIRTESQLYETVLEKIEQIRMVVSDTSTNVRVVDEAVVPLEPRNSRTAPIAFFFIFGLMLGIATAFLRQLLINVQRKKTGM